MSNPFTLTDRNGKAHKYEIELHPATDGDEVFWTLAGLGLPTLAKIGELLLQGDEVGKAIRSGDVKAALGIDFASLFDGLDLAELGKTLENSILDRVDMSKLGRQILLHTTRDGKPLDNDLNYDSAYRGNYLERLQATIRAAKINGFFPVPDITSKSKKDTTAESDTDE